VRRRLALIAAVSGLALAVAGVGIWQWVAGRDPAVPTCDQLAVAVRLSMDGMWTVRRSEPVRAVSDSTVSCWFSVVSADRRFAGDVTVLLVADTNVDELRREVHDGPCDGERLADLPGGRYVASKQCLEMVNGQARSGLFAATSGRFAHVVAAFSGPSAAPSDVVDYARRVALETADRGLGLPART